MSDATLQYLPASADHVVISVNPRAGRRGRLHRAEQVAQTLTERGWHVRVVTQLAEVVELAADLSSRGRLRAVVGAGGDGTMHLLANTLPPEIPLATLPLGTENLLAKYLWLNDLEKVVEAIDHGAVVALDTGYLRCASAPGDAAAPPLERVFLLMVSCGFDALVIHDLHDSRSGNITHLAYAKPILRAIRSYEYPELRLYWDVDGEAGADVACRVGVTPEANGNGPLPPNQPQLVSRWAFAFNLPCYAWGLKFTPEANGVDGHLDVCVLKRGSLWQAARYLLAVLRQRLRGRHDVAFQRVSRFRVEADAVVPVQADGEPAGFLPLEVGVLPGRVRLIVPERWAATHLSPPQATSAVHVAQP